MLSFTCISYVVYRASKPVPVITQDYTNTLEEMILKRVKEGKYDDVVPREMKSRTEVKPDFMLSQEKSDKGLGDVSGNEVYAILIYETCPCITSTLL
jgi:U3 small nucleolar ribonucleoprotein component